MPSRSHATRSSAVKPGGTSVGGPSTATGACAAAGGSVPADPAAVPRARASVCSNACHEGATKVRRRCDDGATTVPRRDGGAGADTRGAGQGAVPRSDSVLMELGGGRAGRWWRRAPRTARPAAHGPGARRAHPVTPRWSWRAPVGFGTRVGAAAVGAMQLGWSRVPRRLDA